ncbi:hypothetical protein SAMN05428951_101512 [Pseudomonas sp. OV546]|nr:hypothetical protein SAMN05428951_101512 [Pseudomonas sp. OV546]
MRDSRLDTSEIRRARAIAFSISVAEAYGCASDSREVAGCEATLDRTVLPGEATPPELLRLWRRRFIGAVASEPSRTLLYERFSGLRAVFDSSLWSLLKPSCGQRSIEEIVSGTRMDGEGLEIFRSNSLALLCSCPDWHNLAPLLAILRSQSPQWLFERSWLRKNFAACCELMCIRPSDRKLAVPLWSAVKILVDQGLLGDIKYWLDSEQSFDYLLQGQIRLGECLIRQGWVSGWTDDCIVWLWYLGERSCSCTVDALRSAAEGTSVDKPADLYMRVRRASAKLASTVISIPA